MSYREGKTPRQMATSSSSGKMTLKGVLRAPPRLGLPCQPYTQPASFPALLTGVAPDAQSGNLLDNIPPFGAAFSSFFQFPIVP